MSFQVSNIWSLAAVLAALAGCGGAPAVPTGHPSSAIASDPALFDRERARAHLQELVQIGSRAPGSEAARRARAWAEASAPNAGGEGGPRIVLLASLATHEDPRWLEAESAAAAVVAEAARALASGGVPIAAALEDDLLRPFAAALSGAPLVIVVRDGCSLPDRRDLLSHRVLRERFFRSAGLPTDPPAFVQLDAGQAELLAAGAARVMALGRTAPADACDPGPLGHALVTFVRDAHQLLTRRTMNWRTPATS